MDVLAEAVEQLSKDKLRPRVEMEVVGWDTELLREQLPKRFGVRLRIVITPWDCIDRGLDGLVNRRQWVLAQQQFDPLECSPALLDRRRLSHPCPYAIREQEPWHRPQSGIRLHRAQGTAFRRCSATFVFIV